MLFRVSLIALVFNIVSCAQSDRQELHIAVSANLAPVMDSIVSIYGVRHKVNCRTVVSASGVLFNQIKSGAKFNLFFSADTLYPIKLKEIGKVNTVQKFVSGRLMVVQKKGKNFTTCERIVIADPNIAPYGKKALMYLKSRDDYDQIKGKIVFAESIGNVNQMLLSGAADAGISSSSYRKPLSVNFDVQRIESIEIEQAYCVMSGSESNSQVLSFQKFLESEEVRRILDHFGYE